MKYLALTIDGHVVSLGDCNDFDEADHKTTPHGEVPALWIMDEEAAKKVAESISKLLGPAQSIICSQRVGRGIESLMTGNPSRYRYGYKGAKVESEVPEQAYGMYIDPTAEGIRDDMVMRMDKGGELSSEVDMEEYIQDESNGMTRDLGDKASVWGGLLRTRVQELLDNHYRESDEGKHLK